MHSPVCGLRNVVPPWALGHGMSTQWPVSSGPLPFAHMHTPMRSWPSTQGGGGGSVGAVDDGPADAGASEESGGAEECDGSADADASGAGDAGADDGADEGAGTPGGTG